MDFWAQAHEDARGIAHSGHHPDALELHIRRLLDRLEQQLRIDRELRPPGPLCSKCGGATGERDATIVHA